VIRRVLVVGGGNSQALRFLAEVFQKLAEATGSRRETPQFFFPDDVEWTGSVRDGDREVEGKQAGRNVTRLSEAWPDIGHGAISQGKRERAVCSMPEPPILPKLRGIGCRLAAMARGRTCLTPSSGGTGFRPSLQHFGEPLGPRRSRWTSGRRGHPARVQ